MKFGILILGFVWILGFGYWTLPTARAVNMESPAFRIEGGNVNIGAGTSSSESYNVSTTLGQLAAGEFQSKGFVVKAGFQYIHSIIPFQFSVSNTQVNLGELLSATPATASTDLTVSFGGAGGYQVTAAELTPLQTESGSVIPDTKCDSPVSDCAPNKAGEWKSKQIFGFGYNMSGVDIPSDFVNLDYFRPFANLGLKQTPEIVMSNSNVVKRSKSRMTFKANISPSQAKGSYQAIISLIATPSF